MKNLLKSLSKDNIELFKIEKTLASIQFLYYYIYLCFGLLLLTLLFNGEILINKGAEEINVISTLFSAFTLFYLGMVIGLSMNVNFLILIKAIKNYIFTDRNFKITDKNFRISCIIKSNEREFFNIIFNGKNIDLKKEARKILVNYDVISNEDLYYFLDKGYYDSVDLLCSDKKIIEKRMEKYKLEKTSNCLENF